MMTMADLREYLGRRLVHTSKVLMKWGDRYRNDPHGAFEWSSQAMQAAAEKTVAEAVAGFVGQEKYEELEGPCLPEVLAFVRSQVTEQACYPARSTSPPSDYLNQETLAHWAKMLRTIEGG
jgi:hypothetical protein